ncbi:MAG: hypothetical protein ACNS62_18815 [Candidatus Cyclobacteriaceae bacterium M3_2C_046]
MRVTVEISYYPFESRYDRPVMEFLESITSKAPYQIVETNNMSTQVSGEFDQVMDLIQPEIQHSFDKYKAVFVLKIANSCDK